MNGRNLPRLCVIGFGEAGQAIASGLREAGIETVAAWDILFPQAEGAPLKAAAARHGVRIADSAADALHGATLVISAVTAASSLEGAKSADPHLSGRPFYLDINSVSPGRKQACAKLFGDRARYVDVAVVAPIHPARHRTAMMLAGPHAEAVAPILQSFDMKVPVVGTEIGDAAAIKMVRSVMIKGIEALTAECFVAAARAGVTDQVATSLSNNYPDVDWAKMIDYNLERMASHGARRAAEMEQVAETLKELGVEPLMTSGTIERQREMGQIGRVPSVKSTLDQGRAAMLSAISKAQQDRH
jgi:3-hydroxyisobutyrate dehydrogenase-like beta-hydroxyacid dehydrogenase